jgi:hypothetical protein
MVNFVNAAVLAATADRWADEFLGFDNDQRFVIVLTAIGCLTGITITLAGIVAGVTSSMHRRRVEEHLKRDMLDRGMSADEIVKVIEAAAPPEDAAGRLVANWGKCKE